MATTFEPQPPVAVSAGLAEQATKRDFWRNGASDDIVSDEQWSVWARHLSKRRLPKPLATLCQASESPLRWGLGLDEFTLQAVELFALADQLQTKPKGKARFDASNSVQALSAWLQGTRALPQSAGFALESLAVAHLLPAVAGEAAEETWWQLLDELWQLAQSATDWRVDSELPPEVALAQQLLAGELPLTLAYLFPEIRPLYKLRATAYEALSEGLVELTNGQGLLRGPYLGVLRPLLACWTRSRAICQRFKKGCWNGKAEEQYAWLATQALSLSAADGRAILGQPHDERWAPEFLATTLRLGGEPADVAAAKKLFGKKLTRLIVGRANNRVPETSDNCEWSGVAVMRAGWEPSGPVVVVDYASPQLRLEVWSGRQKLFGGTWDWETTVNGKRLEAVGPWEETCWFTDKNADFLELAIDLADGARLERQILLAREDRILLLADYVHECGNANVCHRSRLPLDDAIHFQPEAETREGLLSTDKPIARVLPLALPEWRSDPRFGQLTSRDGWLQLEQQRPGKNLACPMFIDLHRPRAGKPCTWRQLTVAESMEILPHDAAVGYRAQCGKQQWLIYRSLAPPANRTLLGQNLSTEFLAARFLAPAGEIDELVEIEG